MDLIFVPILSRIKVFYNLIYFCNIIQYFPDYNECQYKF